MVTKKGTFKSKGEQILKPQSMESFLKGEPEMEVPMLDVDLHKPSNVGLHKKEPHHKTVRFHLQIRQDLADIVFDEIRDRQSPSNGKKASQRAVFEDALTAYFS